METKFATRDEGVLYAAMEVQDHSRRYMSTRQRVATMTSWSETTSCPTFTINIWL